MNYSSSSMPYTTLITPDQLQPHLGAPDWVVVDCRFDLADPAAGRRDYAAAHLPGAVYADLERDLSGPPTGGSGRHPLPPPHALAARLSGWGVGAESQVVAYDDNSGAMASRLWWLLRWLGHDAVAVLDGGLEAWREARLPTTAELAARAPRRFTARPRPELLVDAVELAEWLARDEVLVVDARSPERFRGEVEPIDPVAGHIPGAINRPFTANLDAEGRFLPAAVLREQWQAVLGGRQSAAVVSQCGSGVTACHNLLALERAGLSGARLYPGSWSEWIRDPQRPVACGEA